MVANKVYIHFDLSPAEAKLAFEERQRKRATVTALRSTDQQKSVRPATSLGGKYENGSSSENTDRAKQQVDCTQPNKINNELSFRIV